MTIKEYPTSCSSDMPSFFHTRHVPIMHRVHGAQGWKQIPNGILEVNIKTGKIGKFIENDSASKTEGIRSLLTGKEAQEVLNDTLDGNRLLTPLQEIKFGSSISLYGTDKERSGNPEIATLNDKYELREERTDCQGGTGGIAHVIDPHPVCKREREHRVKQHVTALSASKKIFNRYQIKFRSTIYLPPFPPFIHNTLHLHSGRRT